MAKAKKTKGPAKTVKATSTKTELPAGNGKTNKSTYVQVKVSEKSAQKPTFANQSNIGPAKLKSTAQKSNPKKKSPLIPGKVAVTSHSAVTQKDNTVPLSTANTAPILTFREVEQLDLRKSIGLLFMLNETPQKASPNEIPAFLKQEDGRSSARALTLLREKELAGIFAFLIATSDDPRKVAALCLEESKNQDFLCIKIAANHGDLWSTKEGLDKIARILKACHEGKLSFLITSTYQERLPPSMLTCLPDTTANLQHLLLETIGSLHQNRILCRLQSRHAIFKSYIRKRKLATPKILPVLAQEFEKQTNGGKNLISLAPDINELANLFTNLESLKSSDATSAPGLQILLSILQKTHHLCRNSDLNLLQLSEALRLKLAKLSRYVSASGDLIRGARRYRFFADVSVEIIKFERLPNLLYEPPEDFLESLIARLSLNTTPTKLLSCLNFQGGVVEADKRSAATRAMCELINAGCAVHAEIQLLFYYEFHAPRGLIPRVICSTKSACYLCNLFFSLHGRFYIPSTHGRLYEKWTLPNRVKDLRGSRLNEVIANFSRAVIEAIRRLVAVPSRKPDYRNESAFFFRSGVWSSVTKLSRQSVQLCQAVIHASRPHSVAADVTTPGPGPDESDPKDLNEGNPNIPVLSPSASATKRAEVRSCPSSSTIKTNTTVIPPSPPPPHRLKPGTPLLLEFSDPPFPVRIETACMHIELTRDLLLEDISPPNTEQRGPAPDRAWATVDLLSTSEEDAHIVSSGVASIDVAALAPGAHVTLDQHVVDRGLCGFYVACGAETLLMRCWKEEGEGQDVGGVG